MFKSIFLTVFIFFSLNHLLYGNETKLEWEGLEFYKLGGVVEFNNDIIYVFDLHYNGCIWKVDSRNGNKLDSVITGIHGGELKISQNKKYLIVDNNSDGIEIYETSTLNLVKKLESFDEIHIKNENEFILIQREGVFIYDMLKDEINELFIDLPFDTRYSFRKINIINSCYSTNYNLVFLALDGNQGKFIFVIDENEKSLVGVFGNSFSPCLNNARNKIYINQNNKVVEYDLNDLSKPAKEIYNFPMEEPSNTKFTKEGNFLLTLGTAIYNTDDFSLFADSEIDGWRGDFFEDSKNYYVQNTRLYKYNLSSISKVNETTEEITVFPNPTSNIINIDTETPTNIELFDIFGNKLLEDYNTKLDISQLSPGTYYIRYLGQTKMVVKI